MFRVPILAPFETKLRKLDLRSFPDSGFLKTINMVRLINQKELRKEAQFMECEKLPRLPKPLELLIKTPRCYRDVALRRKCYSSPLLLTHIQFHDPLSGYHPSSGWLGWL